MITKHSTLNEKITQLNENRTKPTPITPKTPNPQTLPPLNTLSEEPHKPKNIRQQNSGKKQTEKPVVKTTKPRKPIGQVCKGTVNKKTRTKQYTKKVNNQSKIKSLRLNAKMRLIAITETKSAVLPKKEGYK